MRFSQPVSQQDIAAIIQMVNQQYQLPNLMTSPTHNYEEARNLYIANIVLNNQLKNSVEEKNILASRILQAQHSCKNRNAFKKKRVRRLGSQIQRLFKCNVGDCTKAYGSEGSLMQHIKLKHTSFYQAHQGDSKY